MKFVLYFLVVFLDSRMIPLARCLTQQKIFQLEALAEHNRLRALHGSPPLVLSNQLSEFAQKWAERLAGTRSVRHQPHTDYGENIFMITGVDTRNINGRTPVNSWYRQIVNYDFEDGDFASNTSHFTQLIWKKAQKLGIGFVKRGNSVWVVAKYSPRGNIEGEFERNVQPPY